MGNSLDELGRERFHPLSTYSNTKVLFSFLLEMILKILNFKTILVILMEISQIGSFSTLQML